MADDKTNPWPADNDHINVNEDHEVAFWSKELGITELELRAAVEKVGLSAEKVREFVKDAK